MHHSPLTVDALEDIGGPGVLIIAKSGAGHPYDGGVAADGDRLAEKVAIDAIGGDDLGFAALSLRRRGQGRQHHQRNKQGHYRGRNVSVFPHSHYRMGERETCLSLLYENSSRIGPLRLVISHRRPMTCAMVGSKCRGLYKTTKRIPGCLVHPRDYLDLDRVRAARAGPLASRKSPDRRKVLKTAPSCHSEPKAKNLSFIVTVSRYSLRRVLDRSLRLRSGQALNAAEGMT